MGPSECDYPDRPGRAKCITCLRSAALSTMALAGRAHSPPSTHLGMPMLPTSRIISTLPSSVVLPSSVATNREKWVPLGPRSVYE